MNGKMKIRIAAAAVAGAAALTAGSAALYAQSGALRGPMAKFDSNSDGAVSLAEARSGVAAMFAGADVNKDGRATHEEMMAFHGKMGGHHRSGDRGDRGGHGGRGDKRGPMHLDSDGDGALTLAEAQSGIETHFAKIDSNRDGSVDAAEIRAAHDAHRGGR
ncbi:MAG TPA: hypothetical protein VF688_05805 [Allosphingosinicella sp.]|jgi:hypothetical protein